MHPATLQAPPRKAARRPADTTGARPQGTEGGPGLFHIDYRTLRRYPILGVFIGVAITAVVVWLLSQGWSEAQALCAQKTPERLSAHDVVNLRGVHWVTVTDGDWHCDAAVTRPRRSSLMRLLRGPVEATEVPITDSTDGEILVATFSGALNCDARAGAPITGVVGSTEIFSSSCTALPRWRKHARHVNVLEVGASPQRAMFLIAAMVAVAVGGLLFAGFYFRLMRRDSQPSTVPSLSGKPVPLN